MRLGAREEQAEFGSEPCKADVNFGYIVYAHKNKCLNYCVLLLLAASCSLT